MITTASWYGWRHSGRRMANGRPFRPLMLTAASKTIPLWTYVRVTNLANGKRVVVMVTDRGPYVRGRDLDLSYAAARRLDMLGKGTTGVRIEILKSGAR